MVKRFVAGEELIARANCEFSSEVRFDRMKKQQSCNYDDVSPMISVPKSIACPPAREEVKSVANKSPTESIGRRFLASAVGLATLVSDPREVCHEEGRFLKIPADILEGILSSSAASHVYFREILQPAWDELGGEDVLISVLQPESLDEHMRSSTDWYVRRVCSLESNLRPACISGSSPPNSGEKDGSTGADWEKLRSCLKLLWQEERQKNTREEQKSLKGRVRKVGEWKVSRLLAT